MIKKILLMVAAILITVSSIVIPRSGFDLAAGLEPINRVVEGISGFTEKISLKTDSWIGDLGLKPDEPAVQEPEMILTVVPTEDPNVLIASEIPAEPEALLIIDPAGMPETSSAKFILPPFKKHWKTPKYTANFADAEAGCAWQGIAGQVFDAEGKPINNLIVKVTGEWKGSQVTWLGLTGLKETQAYGPGGFEIYLGSQPIDTTRKLQLQVFSPDFEPLTYNFYFDTFSDCEKNLVIINFKKR